MRSPYFAAALAVIKAHYGCDWLSWVHDMSILFGEFGFSERGRVWVWGCFFWRGGLRCVEDGWSVSVASEFLVQTSTPRKINMEPKNHRKPNWKGTWFEPNLHFWVSFYFSRMVPGFLILANSSNMSMWKDSQREQPQLPCQGAASQALDLPLALTTEPRLWKSFGCRSKRRFSVVDPCYLFWEALKMNLEC